MEAVTNLDIHNSISTMSLTSNCFPNMEANSTSKLDLNHIINKSEKSESIWTANTTKNSASIKIPKARKRSAKRETKKEVNRR